MPAEDRRPRGVSAHRMDRAAVPGELLLMDRAVVPRELLRMDRAGSRQRRMPARRTVALGFLRNQKSGYSVLLNADLFRSA